MLKDHMIKIEQENSDSYATIYLIDKAESKGDGGLVTGIWRHISISHDGTEIKFTSDNPEYYYWEWRGPHAGTISIGVKMGRASHKAGEESMFQILISLRRARRTSMSIFEVASATGGGRGFGVLTYNVSPHFVKGDIAWTPQYNEE